MSASQPPAVERVAPTSGLEPDTLVLDAQTLRDLEIFRSETEGTSLFDFCNLCRTDGGAGALRQRMERPSCRAASIRATQDALSFIATRRRAFATLPPAYTTARVQRYAREILPTIPHENLLRFAIGAFGMWADDGHYVNIVNGVTFTCGLIRALRGFVAQAELATPGGELASLIIEMRVLLARPRLRGVPDLGAGRRAWKVLRLDQAFRLHEKKSLIRLLQLVYEVDALVAMADVTRKHRFVMPAIEEGPLRVQVQGLVHPYLQNGVANPVELDQERRVLFLTGPNMAGKTTYLRAFATALYLAHLGMGVPAERFVFVPAQRLFSAISLNDDLHGGISYFRAEALRIKAISRAIAEGHRVVALLDEPFKGTNVKDALDASQEILQRFAHMKGCLFMFSSHLIELRDRLRDTVSIDCRYFEADESEGQLRFDYRLHAGVSSQRLGMRVLREEGIFELLDRSMKLTASRTE
jgi:DNA mismatch repair protein MutS